MDRKLGQDQVNRYVSAFDDWLTTHHIMVNRNASRYFFGHVLGLNSHLAPMIQWYSIYSVGGELGQCSRKDVNQ